MPADNTSMLLPGAKGPTGGAKGGRHPCGERGQRNYSQDSDKTLVTKAFCRTKALKLRVVGGRGSGGGALGGGIEKEEWATRSRGTIPEDK